VAAAVGGLVTAVKDERSGVLVDGHDPGRYAAVLAGLLGDPRRLRALAAGAAEHAAAFSWQNTADGLLAEYRDAMAAHARRLALRASAV
jgi:D-inositol-3-phosphate glycosyltransferase